MKKIKWYDGALVIRANLKGRYDWGYCGGGPVFHDVAAKHPIAALESLLGWDHPAAKELHVFIRDTGGQGDYTRRDLND